MNYLVSKILKFITEQNVISDEKDVQEFYKSRDLSLAETHNSSGTAV